MTLVELMVSLVISSFVIAGVYGVYTLQKKSYTVQEQVAEMQQRLRSAMDFLVRDIRMAGSNPDMESRCSTKITTAAADNMVFRACNMDTDDNDFEITVNFNSGENKISLTRNNLNTNTANSMPIAESVDWFEMLYISGYDNVGNPIPADVATKDGRDKIRAVQISLLIRSSYPDMKYTDTTTYKMGSGTEWTPPAAAQHYHRRLLVTTIQLRNMLQ
ncbi:hypothetical protein GCAAIG_08670 [Candidatus Electronema halotolerans]